MVSGIVWAIVGWSRSAVVASVRAVLLPAYSNFAVRGGHAILLVLCLVVLVRVAPPAAWIRLPVAPIRRTARASKPESVG